MVPATLKFRCHIAAIRDRRHWVDFAQSQSPAKPALSNCNIEICRSVGRQQNL